MPPQRRTLCSLPRCTAMQPGKALRWLPAGIMFPISNAPRRTNRNRVSLDGSCACATRARLCGLAGSVFPTLPPAPGPEALAVAWESEVLPCSHAARRVHAAGREQRGRRTLCANEHCWEGGRTGLGPGRGLGVNWFCEAVHASYEVRNSALMKFAIMRVRMYSIPFRLSPFTCRPRPTDRLGRDSHAAGLGMEGRRG